MESIEIKQHPKLIIGVIALLALFFIFSIYALLFEDWEGRWVWMLVQIVLSLILLYGLAMQAWKYKSRAAIIAFTNEAVILNEGFKPVRIERKDIKGLQVEKDEDNGGSSLLVITEKKTHSIGLNWLDKQPDEIRQIVQRYRMVDLS